MQLKFSPVFILSNTEIFIFKGDEGNKFYIIIQGAVYILLKKKGIIEQDPASVQNVPDRFIKGFNEEGLTNEKKIRKVEDHYPGFWVARVMKDGESFGDIALQVSGDRLGICFKKNLSDKFSSELERQLLSVKNPPCLEF